MGVILAITQGLNLIATIGPIGIGIALQIKKLLSSPDSGETFEVQIQMYRDGILKTINEEDAIIAEWRAAHPQA